MLMNMFIFSCFLDEKCVAEDDLSLSHAPRVYVQNVSVFAGTTRICVFNMWAWCRYTRGRFERAHGGFLACHTTHNTTPHHTKTEPETDRKKTEEEDRERSFRCICLVYNRFDVRL